MKKLFGMNLIIAALVVGAFVLAPAAAQAQGPAPKKAQVAQCHGPKGGPGHHQIDRHHGPKGPGPRFVPQPRRAPMPPPPGPRFVEVRPVMPPPAGYVWQPCVGGWALVNLGPVVIGLGW